MFYSSSKLIANDQDIDEAFKSMHQSIMTKTNCACKDWIVLNVIINPSVSIRRKGSMKKWDNK